MVLAELGQRISQALGSLNAVPVVDEAVRRRLPPAAATSSLSHCCCWWLLSSGALDWR